MQEHNTVISAFEKSGGRKIKCSSSSSERICKLFSDFLKCTIEFITPSSQKKGILGREKIGERKRMKWEGKGEKKRGKGKGWSEIPLTSGVALALVMSKRVSERLISFFVRLQASILECLLALSW